MTLKPKAIENQLSAQYLYRIYVNAVDGGLQCEVCTRIGQREARVYMTVITAIPYHPAGWREAIKLTEGWDVTCSLGLPTLTFDSPMQAVEMSRLLIDGVLIAEALTGMVKGNLETYRREQIARAAAIDADLALAEKAATATAAIREKWSLNSLQRDVVFGLVNVYLGRKPTMQQTAAVVIGRSVSLIDLARMGVVVLNDKYTDPVLSEAAVEVITKHLDA